MYKYRNPNFLSILLLVFSLINSVSPRFLPLHIEGKYLVDSEGNRHIIHGFAQTYSPWFNEREINGIIIMLKVVFNIIKD